MGGWAWVKNALEKHIVLTRVKILMNISPLASLALWQ